MREAYSTFRTSRRSVLRLAGISAAAGVSSAACHLLATDPADEGVSGSGTGETTANEAPILVERVEKGELPPVRDRLPEEPMVIRPVDRRGVYGGTWSSFLRGSDTSRLGLMIGYEPLVRWSSDWSQVIPNVAKDWSRNEFGTEYVLELREGMKWSDGEPFTADDVLFAYEDVLLNRDIYPVTPSFVMSGGEPARLEKVDTHTVRFTFARPWIFFPEYLAQSDGLLLCQQPKHYLAEFHKSYNEGVDRLASEEGYPGWSELFSAMGDLWERTGVPRLHAWTITTPSGEGTRVVAERNPYYFKTDADGRQLPYLDRVTWEVVNSDEVAVLKATNGELGAELWESINTLSNKPILARSREEGNYHFTTVVESLINYSMIALNLTHGDPAMREIFQNQNFRIGLSHAINRQEIVDTVFQRQGTPWQGAPHPESSFAYDELGTQYVEYDTDKANEYLDRVGYERDDDGFRVRGDGNRLGVTVDVAARASSPYPYVVDVMELVREYWQEVGVETSIRPSDRTLFSERLESNEFEVSVWPGGKALSDAILSPDWYMPYNEIRAFAPLWAKWYRSGGAEGEEPSDSAKRQMELYDSIKETGGEDERRRLFRQILEIAKDEFFAIGIALPAANYGIVRNNFHNVPSNMPGAWIYQTPGPTAPEQYFVNDNS